jgi:hypothetical protein
LLQRLQNEIAKPDAKAKFRGSLVDENMFAIDTNEWGLANLLEENRRLRMQERERSANPRAAITEIPPADSSDRETERPSA